MFLKSSRRPLARLLATFLLLFSSQAFAGDLVQIITPEQFCKNPNSYFPVPSEMSMLIIGHNHRDACTHLLAELNSRSKAYSLNLKIIYVRFEDDSQSECEAFRAAMGAYSYPAIFVGSGTLFKNLLSEAAKITPKFKPFTEAGMEDRILDEARAFREAHPSNFPTLRIGFLSDEKDKLFDFIGQSARRFNARLFQIEPTPAATLHAPKKE